MSDAPVALVAMADNGVIGRDNGLPWHLPDDLKRFKAITLGHSVLMGRRTFESIGKALPGRRNLVLTRNPAWNAPGCETVTSVDAALRNRRRLETLRDRRRGSLFALLAAHRPARTHRSAWRRRRRYAACGIQARGMA